MSREELNNAPAQVIEVANGKSSVVREGTRKECWNYRAREQNGYYDKHKSVFVFLK